MAVASPYRALAALAVATATVLIAGAIFTRAPLRLYAPLALVLLVAPGALRLWRTDLREGREAALAGAALAAVIAPTAWIVTHPVVHVDNATGATIQVWVDGARGPLVAPSPSDREPERLRLGYGVHRIGWSLPGEDKAREDTLVRLLPLADHLYNPAGAGCYWIEAAAYGDADVIGTPHGPQRLAQFYRLEHVDAWFSPAPTSVQAPRLLGGARRLALRRYATCMALADLGCGRTLRAAFVVCERAFTGPGEPLNCNALARAACSASTSASASPPPTASAALSAP